MHNFFNKISIYFTVVLQLFDKTCIRISDIESSESSWCHVSFPIESSWIQSTSLSRFWLYWILNEIFGSR